MAVYGHLHTIGDFVRKLTPKTGRSSDTSFLHQVLLGLKKIDAVQRRNPLVTATASTGGGIRVHHRGLCLFMIIPGQKSLRVITGMPGDGVAEYFDHFVESGRIVDSTGENNYRQWNIPVAGLSLLWEYIEQLEARSDDQIATERRRGRYIPGAIREAALTAFEQAGRVCPGVGVPGRQQRAHKVGVDVPIEFDHVLPISRGGSNGYANVQVLCGACNRIKRDTAY